MNLKHISSAYGYEQVINICHIQLGIEIGSVALWYISVYINKKNLVYILYSLVIYVIRVLERFFYTRDLDPICRKEKLFFFSSFITFLFFVKKIFCLKKKKFCTSRVPTYTYVSEIDSFDSFKRSSKWNFFITNQFIIPRLRFLSPD